MKDTRHANTRRVLRRDERERRVQAGKPSNRLDYRRPLCQKWFSSYRNRHGIHRAHCKKKRARQVITQRERNRAQTPLPPPNHFIHGPSVLGSPTPVPSSPGGTEQDQQVLNDDILDIVPQQLGDIFHPPSATLDEVLMLDDALALLAGDGDPGESNMVFSWFIAWMYSHVEIYPATPVLDEEVCLQQDQGEPNVPSGGSGSAVQDPVTWPLELGQTLIIYHPHAQRPPQVIPTSELSTFSRNPDISEDPIDDTRPPYFPFRSLADFEQTELFIKRNCADPFVNKQLDLWRCYAPNSGVTLKNAREMHQCLWAAGIEEDLSQVVS